MKERQYRTLPVQLTPAEQLERAQQAATRGQEYRIIEDEKKESTREFTRELKALRTEIDALHDAVRTGKEDQKVEIVERRNENRMSIETVRMDTGEVIESRPMSVEERQLDLYAIYGGRVDDAPPAPRLTAALEEIAKQPRESTGKRTLRTVRRGDPDDGLKGE